MPPAVAVDQITGNREIVVKPVGPQVASVPGIFGATIMGDGSVVVILDVAPLVRRQQVALPRDVGDVRPLDLRPRSPGELEHGCDRGVGVATPDARLGHGDRQPQPLGLLHLIAGEVVAAPRQRRRCAADGRGRGRVDQ